ncbi:MAG: hypothetical protein K2O16_18730 [Lachnospiraceae bacterium]|nr:hypothetical protein [Lachnospiraceae bacterium]
MGTVSKEEVLKEFLEEAGGLLEELYQSGFDTVHDSTLEALGGMGKLAGEYGMGYLSMLLGQLTGGLAMGRHQMKQKKDGITEIYVKLNEYLYLCREKTACDTGKNYYIDGEEKQYDESKGHVQP